MKYFYSLLLVFISVGTFAQTTYSLGGTLKNGDTNEPIVGATIFAIRSDSTLAGGAISDDKGRFNLELPRGEYVIKINYLGLAPYNESLRVRRDDYLGTIVMSANTENLEGVEVKRKAVQATVQGDTTSFNAKAYKTNQNARCSR